MHASWQYMITKEMLKAVCFVWLDELHLGLTNLPTSAPQLWCPTQNTVIVRVATVDDNQPNEIIFFQIMLDNIIKDPFTKH